MSTIRVSFRFLARALATLVALGAATVAVAACSAPEAPDPTETTTPPSPSSSAAPSPTAADTARVAAGGVELEVTAPGPHGIEVTDGPAPGTRTLALDLAGGGTATAALASPGTLTAHRDGSVSVLDPDGLVTAGLDSPDDGAGFRAVDATHVRVDTAGPITTTLGTVGVSSTDWGEREGGRSIAVDPTAWARAAGEAGTELVWAELVAAYPEVDTATMHDQLECHAIGAPDKATWNLEPWRPDVGLVATMAARCNPIP